MVRRRPHVGRRGMRGGSNVHTLANLAGRSPAYDWYAAGLAGYRTGQHLRQMYNNYTGTGAGGRRLGGNQTMTIGKAYRPRGATIVYKKPPRERLVKGWSKLTKKDKAKLYRERIKFPISASVKVILGNQTPPANASSPLGAQWTRATGINLPTGADANVNLCGYVVPLTKQHGLKVGQGNMPASTESPSAGVYSADNLLWSINTNNTKMNGEAHNYVCTGLRAQSDADYLVAGVRGGFTIGGMQQSTDQRVYCQIVRAFNAPHAVDTISEDHFKELVNAQSLPNNQHWQCLWRYSCTLKGRATGSARVSTKYISFNLPLNYKRSKTKKVSTASSATGYGTQLGYAYENSEEMYNTLYLVITSRALNTSAQEAVDTLSGSTTHPDVQDGGGRMNPRIGIKGYVQTFYKYRNSQVKPGNTASSSDDEE